MADPDIAYPCRKPLHEGIVDAALDEEPARRRAALAVQRVDHEHGGIERPIEVRILEHDHRVLAAQFEMHPLQGRRALGHDLRAGRRFADEGDSSDRLVLGQRDARIFAQAVHQVVRAGGQAGFLADFGEDRGGERAPFRRLVDDRAARRQGRRDLPGRQHERRVPRRDDADRADRLPGRVVQVLVGRQGEAVRRLGRAVGEIAVVGRRTFGRRLHEADGLAGIEAFEQRDLLAARHDQVGDPVQDLLARLAGSTAPVRERRFGRFGGLADLRRSSARHVAELGIIDRGQILESLARRARIRRPADVMRQDARTDTLPVGRQFRQMLVQHIGHSAASAVSARAFIWSRIVPALKFRSG